MKNLIKVPWPSVITKTFKTISKYKEGSLLSVFLYLVLQVKNILAKLIIWGYDLYLLFCLYKIKKTSKLSTYLAKISLGLEIETSGLHTLSIPHSWRNATWNKMLLLRYLRKTLIDILFLATQMLFLVKSRFTRFRAYKGRKHLFFQLCVLVELLP